jgi:hypothetical protein
MPDRHHALAGRKPPRALIALASLLATALPVFLAGCGGSSQEGITTEPAAQILAASVNAARNARSVQVTSRSRLGRTPADFELQLAGEEGGRARSTVGDSHGEVIRVGDTVYLKAGQILAQRLEKTTGAHVTPGTWLQLPATNAQVASSAFLTKPDGELIYLLKTPTLSLTKGPIVTIDGQKAIELKTQGKLYTGKIYVAATGTPYPIEIVRYRARQGEGASRTTFVGWNKPVSLPPPPKATQLASLEHEAG